MRRIRTYSCCNISYTSILHITSFLLIGSIQCITGKCELHKMNGKVFNYREKIKFFQRFGRLNKRLLHLMFKTWTESHTGSLRNILSISVWSFENVYFKLSWIKTVMMNGISLATFKCFFFLWNNWDFRDGISLLIEILLIIENNIPMIFNNNSNTKGKHANEANKKSTVNRP